MNEINYARLSGALSVNLNYIGQDLLRAGIISRDQLEKVEEISKKLIDESYKLARQ